MVNNVVLIGRLTKDVEMRKTNNGTSVANFTVAVNRRFGKDKDQADFIRCVAWRQTAEFLSQYAGKGNLVSVEGRIETGSYQDTDGKTVYTTEVVADSVQLLESRKDREQQEAAEVDPLETPTAQFQQQSYGTEDFYETTQEKESLDIHSDELPF